MRNPADPADIVGSVVEAGLQDVPVAISAYTAETRQLLGLQNVQDYTAFTPGLSYSGSNDRVFVRGIGRQTNTNGSDPGVATYTDGVYDAQTFTVAAGLTPIIEEHILQRA